MNNKINMKTLGVIGTLALALAALPGSAFAQAGVKQNGHSETTRIPEHHKSATTTSSPAANATSGATAKLSAQDSQFISKAAQGGMMEVAMGKVAAKKATHPDVKNFGQRMVTDHSRANSELMAIAKSHGVSPAKSASSEKWTSDKEYMSMMLSDHQKDLAEFKTEAAKGTDPQLKKFAADTSRIIAEHLKMAKQISSKL